MPTISTFYGILIQMFWSDHAPPHFPSLYAEHEALIDIRTLDIAEGEIPPSGSRLDSGMGAGSSRRTHGELGAMRTQSATPQDSPLAITPPIQPRMPWRVATVNVLPDFRPHVRFVDDTEGIVDLTALVHSSGAGVFASLADPVLFAQVFVKHGAVTGPGEIDLAPEAMYAAIKKM